MTTIQALHHEEQMEAHRAEFGHWWRTVMRPMLIAEGFTEPEIAHKMIKLWSRRERSKPRGK